MSILDEQALERYATVRLTADLSGLTVNERAMIPILILRSSSSTAMR